MVQFKIGYIALVYEKSVSKTVILTLIYIGNTNVQYIVKKL